MVDVRLYCHEIWPYSRTPIYTDYYLTDNEISAFNHRGRPWKQNRVWGMDVWRDLAERRRWTSASVPNLLMNISVNTSEGTAWGSRNRQDINITNGLSHGIYLTNRIRRPCTVDIPLPFLNVNIRDGVFLHEGRARLKRVRRGSPSYPSVIEVHLDLPDEEPSRKFKDLSNHLARVVEEPDYRGFFFWFIKRQRGQWNTPVKDSFAYFIDLKREHRKYRIHAGDCIKFVVVISERNPSSSPLPSQNSSSTTSPPSLPTHHSSIDRMRSPPSTAPSPPSTAPSSHPPPHPPHPPRPRTRDRTVQTDRISTKKKTNQTRTEHRMQTKNSEIQTIEETSITNHKQIQTNEPPIIVLDPTFYDGEEVLARWGDDRWYYKGRIVRRYDKDRYDVQDITGRRDVISSEHIIQTTDHYDAVSPVKRASGRVLAPHPIYHWSYAPGRVVETLHQHLTVRFYDNNQTNIKKWNVYPAKSREQYDKDVAEIRHREKDWEGKEAVIRDASGVYRLGKVGQQIGCQQRYTVRWNNGQCGEQMSIHIYGTYSPMVEFKVGSYILALADPDERYFLPGEVKRVIEDGDVQRLHVVFVNGKRSRDVLSTDSYWMNKMAFSEAKEVFLTHHQDSSDEEKSPRYD